MKNKRGQAVVEFTLCFILILVVAWIPADFGLAFYTGQLALNASREGARIAAADPTTASASCVGQSACLAGGNILQETATRLSAALLTNTRIDVTLDGAGAGCNRMVTVQVRGDYNFFFYQMLRLFSANVPNAIAIDRVTKMRWEHQATCA